MSAPVAIFGLRPILLCALSNAGVGAAWYSPLLFGPAARRLALRAPDARADALAAGAAAGVTAPLLCFLLAVVGTADANEGVLWALALALLSAGLQAPSAARAGRPAALTLIEQGNHAVALLVCGGLLGAIYGEGA